MWRLTIIALLLALYFAPFLAGLGRRRRFPDSAWSLQFVFFINLLLGWTAIGWLLAWWLAFRQKPLPVLPQGGWVGPRPDRPIWDDDPAAVSAPDLQPDWNRPNAFGGADAGFSKTICPTCHGTGRMQCRMCWGRGTWWVQPTTANDTAKLEGCENCQRSGKVQCDGPGPHL